MGNKNVGITKEFRAFGKMKVAQELIWGQVFLEGTNFSSKSQNMRSGDTGEDREGAHI